MNDYFALKTSSLSTSRNKSILTSIAHACQYSSRIYHIHIIVIKKKVTVLNPYMTYILYFRLSVRCVRLLLKRYVCLAERWGYGDGCAAVHSDYTYVERYHLGLSNAQIITDRVNILMQKVDPTRTVRVQTGRPIIRVGFDRDLVHTRTALYNIILYCLCICIYIYIGTYKVEGCFKLGRL